MTIKSNGRLIEGYVLAAWSIDVSFGTIILPDEKWKVETDIAIFANSAKTQILVSQDFKLTLSQHYSSLIDVVNVLKKEKENNIKYEELKELIKRVSDVVETDLKEFDKVIEDSKATVSVYGSESRILGDQIIDDKEVEAEALGPEGGYAYIHGHFKSWRPSGNYYVRYVTFDGNMNFVSSILKTGQVLIDPWYTIKIADEGKLWGWGTITQTYGEGHDIVMYICWIGVGGWWVSVETYHFNQYPSSIPVVVEAFAPGDSDMDRAYLSLV